MLKKIDEIRLAFDEKKKRYEKINGHKDLIFVKKEDLKFFVDAIDYMLTQQVPQETKKIKKEKKPSD